jgi:hypothetical protein
VQFFASEQAIQIFNSWIIALWRATWLGNKSGRLIGGRPKQSACSQAGRGCMRYVFSGLALLLFLHSGDFHETSMLATLQVVLSRTGHGTFVIFVGHMLAR